MVPTYTLKSKFYADHYFVYLKEEKIGGGHFCKICWQRKFGAVKFYTVRV